MDFPETLEYVIYGSTLTKIGDAIRDGYIMPYGKCTPESMPEAIRLAYQNKYNEGDNLGYSRGYEIGKEEGKINGKMEGIKEGREEEQQYTDGLIERTLTVYSNDRIATIGTGTFRGYTNLTDVSFANVKIIRGTTFLGCTELKNVYFPALATIYGNDFNGCVELTTFVLPKIETIGNQAFNGCTNLNTIVIGSQSDTECCELKSTNAFSNTPISSGTGSIFVPDTLVDSYKTATNWSAYATAIKPMSEYTGG